VNEAIDEKDLEESDEDIFCGTGYAIVTTYEGIRRHSEIWTQHKWSYVILDEGQKIRNPDADVTLACKRLRTPHRFLLSGTPLQNDLRDLWSLFDFVFPGRLGTLPIFETEFADPIKRGGYSNATPMQVQLAYRCALTLRDIISPYLLRRLKKDVREVSRMPGKTEQVLFCRLSPRQRSLYESYLQSDEVMGIMRGSTQLFRAITVLRKICNHPDLVCGSDKSSFEAFVRKDTNPEEMNSEEDEDDIPEDDEKALVNRAGKLEVLAKILPLWFKQGHRVLIFCQWRKMLNIIERFTRLQGWKFGRLDGNTSVASRQDLVDKFNQDTSYFGMLMTTKTGGVGLNLTGADRIILYDPDWNPQTDAQARERAWRFGQKNSVTVYRLITAGAIEEKIYQRQIFKTAITNQVLQDPRQRRLFSQKDLRDLFSLKSDVGSVARGGMGMTETGEITKGNGVVDLAAKDSDERDSEKDNEYTLETVMKSKGLAGVFDHDAVDKPSSRKSISAQEMEEKARKVANRAAKALKESTEALPVFTPTWTGASGTESTGRFGSSKPDTASRSSSSLLSQIRKKQNAIKSAPGGNDNESTNKFATLMKRIKDFIRSRTLLGGQGGPTTDQLLTAFKDVSNEEAAIFRQLLKTVAIVQGGRWSLK